MRTVPFQPMDPALYREVVRRALAEDLGWGDVTTDAIVPGDLRAHGVVVCKCDCVIAGLDVAAEVFTQLDPGCAFDRKFKDGDRCKSGDTVAELRGQAAAMLTAERTALNFLQRLSGIATLTRKFVDATGGRITILDTRKTTPTLRALEKYAVRAGSGTNHRAGLDDGILIKDNHIAAAGGVREAILRARAHAPHLLKIEVECEDEQQVSDAVESGAEVILLDNMPIERLRANVAWIRAHAPLTIVEASGGIGTDPERLAAVAATGVDLISLGALTHSAPTLDISLEFAAQRPAAVEIGVPQ